MREPLAWLLWATVALPAFAFAWGSEDGRLIFVLYREPKLVASAVLGWILVAAFAWTRRRELGVGEVARVLERPPVLLLLAFLAYLATTGLWVKVPENYLYELDQYLLLFPLLVVLLLWTERDARVPGWVLSALVTSLAAVTAVGLWQLAVPIPWLAPIDPGLGAPHPSFMGYKNPAALAVLGQLFLLAGWTLEEGARRSRRLAGGIVLAAELAWLATLESRTSYAALAVGTLAGLVLFLARRPSRRRTFAVLAVTATVLALFAALLVAYAPTRERAASLLGFAADPGSYLRGDRGTYLRNTLNMARHNPLGVGLGDWQTQYPVYREFNRDWAFTTEVQVRRAHSDHVQFLGEAGWPGLGLWLLFLVLVFAAPARAWLTSGRRTALFAAAQLAALTAAMAFDYLVELPYNKLELFLVVFLAVAASNAPVPRGPRRPVRPRLADAVALAVVALALVHLVYYAGLAWKVQAAAALESLYQRAVPAADRPADAADLDRVLARGAAFAALPGHTKTFHRDFLLIAHAAYLRGHRDLAREATAAALRLHPYHPNALRLMSLVADDPTDAERWRAAWEHVMNEATRGFERPYPDLP